MSIHFKAINILKCNLMEIFIKRNRHFKVLDNVEKRGNMLGRFVEDRDKKKHWHMGFMSKPQKSSNIFDKVHKPSRRVTVLNALFVRNITDILSTSDIAPEVLEHGIEITKIKVTSDFQIVNVYYEIPPSKLDSSEHIQKILSIRGPQLRAELISRNILGRVPKLYFVRDQTNSQLAEFEKVLKSADMGPEDKERIIPEEDFLSKNLFVFKKARENKKTRAPSSENKVQETCVPKNPADMKSNVLGLNHDALMTRLYNSKKQSKCVLMEESLKESQNNDLFSQIPGTPLQPLDDREKLLKKFCLERKIMIKEKARALREIEDDNEPYRVEVIDDSLANSNYEPDYYEEEENVK